MTYSEVPRARQGSTDGLKEGFSAFWSSRYWEYFDEVRGAPLSRGRLGEQGQGRCGRVGRDPAGVAAAGRELCEQGIEAMKGRVVVGAPAGLLVPGAVGGLGRGDGVAGAPSFGQGLVVEQQRRPSTAKMPLQVAGQQAKEQVRAYPAFLAVADRPAGYAP